MLRFFEKYQKAFFIFVTFLIIGSFAFTGVMDTFGGNDAPQAKPDRKLSVSISGAPLMLSEVQNLSRFIATDRSDLGISRSPNLCNDGVIRHDLLETGIADLLVFEYFDAIKDDLGSRLEKIKKYRGYENPEAPFINVRAVWDQYKPEVTKQWDSLKNEENVTPATFSQLSRLYLGQASIHPEWIRRVLLAYGKQTSWIKPDPYLQHADLSLFGFQTVSDWFGQNFVDLAAQFILNSAKYAEAKGYKVHVNEAKAELARIFQESSEKMGNRKIQMSLTDHLRSLGLSEKEAIAAYRNILLSRRYFQEVASSTFKDPLPVKEFAAYAGENFVIQKYEWPESIHLQSAQDLIDFQVYLQAIGGQIQSLSLPTNFASVETVAEQTPELVQASYQMHVASITLDEVGYRASLKQVLDWQLDPTNWDILVYAFPFLEKNANVEERFASIDKLSPDMRAKIDLFTRREWAKKNLEMTFQLLQEKKGEEKTIWTAQNWISIPEIENPRELCALLESAADGDCIVKELLERYSDLGQTFYRFDSIVRTSRPHILTFQEAKEIGVMNKLSDRFLETEYKKLRSKHASQFQNKEGEWKLFSTVKEEIATLVFADLFKKISKEKQTLAYYATHRLEKMANEALSAIRKNEGEAWLQSGRDPISDQFKLVKKKSVIQRTTKDEWMKSHVFTMLPNDWSPVYIAPNGNISFFYFENREPAQEPILEPMTQELEVIAADAKRFIAKTIITKSLMKKSILLPIKE